MPVSWAETAIIGVISEKISDNLREPVILKCISQIQRAEKIHRRSGLIEPPVGRVGIREPDIHHIKDVIYAARKLYIEFPESHVEPHQAVQQVIALGFIGIRIVHPQAADALVAHFPKNADLLNDLVGIGE
jgi:hypothetical protein